MKTTFRNSFLKDIKAVRDKQLLARLKQVIEEVDQAGSLTSVSNLKPRRGDKHHYRIRIGGYRLGNGSGRRSYVRRFLHRKEIYRYFP